MLKWRAQQHSQPETTKRITRHWRRRLQSHTFGRGVRKVITENQLHSEHTTFIGCPNCWNNPMLGTKTACSYSSSPVYNKPYPLWLNYSLVHSYHLLWLLIWSAGLSVNLFTCHPHSFPVPWVLVTSIFWKYIYTIKELGSLPPCACRSQSSLYISKQEIAREVQRLTWSFNVSSDVGKVLLVNMHLNVFRGGII